MFHLHFGFFFLYNYVVAQFYFIYFSMVSNSLWFHKLQHPKTKGNKIWNLNRFYNGLKLVFLNRLSFKYELALWEILAMSALINVFF